MNKCLVCEKELELIWGESEPGHYYGTHFIAFGNYGSGVFDPIDGDVATALVAVVCDSCMVAKKDMICFRQTIHSNPVISYQPWCPMVEDE